MHSKKTIKVKLEGNQESCFNLSPDRQWAVYFTHFSHSFTPRWVGNSLAFVMFRKVMAARGYTSHCGGKQRRLASLCLLKILKQIVQDGKSIQACSSSLYNALCADKGLLGHSKQTGKCVFLECGRLTTEPRPRRLQPNNEVSLALQLVYPN